MPVIVARILFTDVKSTCLLQRTYFSLFSTVKLPCHFEFLGSKRDGFRVKRRHLCDFKQPL